MAVFVSRNESSDRLLATDAPQTTSDRALHLRSVALYGVHHASLTPAAVSCPGRETSLHLLEAYHGWASEEGGQ